MSIVAQITAERDRYVAYFEAGVAHFMAAESKTTTRELLISINDESLPYPYRYLRADIVTRRPDGSTGFSQLKGDLDPKFEGRGYDVGGPVVEIHPFSWDEVQIAFDAEPRDLPAIEAFITRWLDIDDARRRRDQNPANVIHSASRIETTGRLWFLTIDFGTAPADALLDLIDLLLNQGMKRVIILTPPQA